MITQKCFVEACHRAYARKSVEIGNPFHGDWHKCHYPLPLCKGGTEWVWLMKHHHAIHGVIQSEELKTCCLFGWEKSLLPRYYVPFFTKWKRHQIKNSEIKDKWRSWFESEEGAIVREQMAIASGKTAVKNRKPVLITFEDGSEKQFPSLTKAAHELNLQVGNLSNLIRSRKIHRVKHFSARFV
jgi:hypothetical protein